MLTTEQKRVIEQVVNVFETGKPAGRYHSVTVMPDGIGRSRQITYGRSQTTEQGNLKTLIAMYAAANGLFAAQLSPYIARIGVTPLADDATFKQLLRQSALEDPIMRQCQDDFFEQLYYQPAEHFFKSNNFKLALSMLVIYDSYVHSGSVPIRLRNRFPERTPLNGGDEKAWVKAYVDTRHHWLENHGNLLLRKTIYRTQCFKEQLQADNWSLQADVVIRGLRVVGAGRPLP